MLFLLSPAKTLDYETPLPAAVQRRATEPLFTRQAAELIGVLRRKTPAQVAALMELSDALATLNVGRYAAWQPQATALNSRPAVYAFNGDVYEGLQAPTLKAADLKWAQDHVVILSGLYGVLRPLDRLQPYRLEMGTTLANAQGRDLYAFWGDTIAQHLNERLAGERSPVIVNLASQEYARAALRLQDSEQGRDYMSAPAASAAARACARTACHSRTTRRSSAPSPRATAASSRACRAATTASAASHAAWMWASRRRVR